MLFGDYLGGIMNDLKGINIVIFEERIKIKDELKISFIVEVEFIMLNFF